MNVYQENYEKYLEFSKTPYESYYKMSQKLKFLLVPRSRKPVANAIVVLGFSGNGKSTWIDKFVENNPEYKIISMDETVFDLYTRLGRKPVSEEIIKAFGDNIDKNCSLQKNVVIDGNFLNLLTRSALTDTLRTYNYQVNLVDITDKIMDVLPTRIMDVIAKKDCKKNDKMYAEIKKEVIDFYLKERESSNIYEQKLLDILSLGADKVFTENDSYESMTGIGSSQR